MKKFLKLLIMAGLTSLFVLTACGAGENPVQVAAPEVIANRETILSDGTDDLSNLRIPYVGEAHATHRIVNALALPGEKWLVGSIQIGADQGDFAERYSPYTLTIFYEPPQGSVIAGTRDSLEMPEDVFISNSDLLFELIENLQAVTFSVRLNHPEAGEADSGFFYYRWSRSRSGEYSIDINGSESGYFMINIEQMRDVNLGFSVLHEVNYNDAFEEIRGFRFDGEGDRLVIWANQPMYNLSLIAIGHDFLEDKFQFFVTDTVFTVDKLDPASAEAFVIDSYYGMGTMPWSGITFEDEFGRRRYFALMQSGYDGRFHLNEFEPALIPESITVAEAWQEAYAVLLRKYAELLPLPNEGYTPRSFILTDIDKDGVPELIITYIAAGIWGESMYSFIDGEVVQLEFLDNFFAYFEVYARPDHHRGIITRAYGNIDIMQIDGESIFVEVNLQSPFFAEDSRWYLDGTEVTQDEHNNMLNSILAGGWENLEQLWPYEITEANIQSVIFRNYSQRH